MGSTNRPYVVCHMLMALDGKIDGACMSAAYAKAYGQLRTTFDCQATVYGTKTMSGTYSDGLAPADLPAGETVLPHEDYAAQSDVHNFIVSADPQGILGWNGKYIEKRGRPKAHVIEVLTEQVSNEYLAYLRRADVSYVFAGKERLDCTLLLSKLKSLFRIDRLMQAGGGQMNWYFAQEDLIDELSIILTPTADGSRTAASLFERAAFLPECPPAAFHLKAVEKLEDDGLWLRCTKACTNFSDALDMEWTLRSIFSYINTKRRIVMRKHFGSNPWCF